MKKMMRLLFKILLVLVLMMSLVACAKKTSMDNSYTTTQGAREAESAPMAPQDAGTTDSKAYGNAATGDTNNDALANRKIIQNKYIAMETLDFDEVTAQVENLAFQYLGYTENAEVTGKSINIPENYSARHASYTFRIPSKDYNNFINDLKGLGNVVTERVNKEDVTMQYFDLKARVDSLKVEETRLLQIVEEGADLSQILEVEAKLSDVRYQIETYTASLKNLENLVDYGTVQLELQEVFKETIIEAPAVTVGDKISKGFTHSVENVKNFFVGLFIFLVTASPYLVLWGLVIFGVVVLIKKLDARNAKNQAKKAKETKEAEAKRP